MCLALPLEVEVRLRRNEWFFSFRPWAFSWKEMPKFRFGLLFAFDSSRTGTGDGCLFLLERRASDLKPLTFLKNRLAHGGQH